MMPVFDTILRFIREQFSAPEAFIPLHAPYFGGNEKKYVSDTIASTFVSSVGAYVNRFEEMMAEITGARYAIATVNGTTALHLSLVVTGVKPGNEVITQALTFVATANAISHSGATPVFIDVDKDTAGMSPAALQSFLENHADVVNDVCINKRTGKVIAACVPMHSFGLPCRIDEIAIICKKWNIALVEDTAESLGSFYKNKHTGNDGLLAAFSFNGNKTVTCGGGGAIITNDETLAKKAKHLSTTAKLAHAWKFEHDEVAYNYRLPNLNAALACAQLEQLPAFLENKQALAQAYKQFFSNAEGITYLDAIKDAKANYWLNAIIFENPDHKDAFLAYSNSNQVMTRPAWALMTELPMYTNCFNDGVHNAQWLAARLVNIPSSVRPHLLNPVNHA